MDEQRKGVISHAFVKMKLRKEFSFHDIANLKRAIGNIVLEPEMRAINATADEIVEIIVNLLREIFEEAIPSVNEEKQGGQ